MIKCDNNGTVIKGSIIDMLEEFTNIIRAVKMSLENDLGEEAAAEIIQKCGKLAFANGEMSKQTAIMDEIFKALIEGKPRT